MTPTEKRKLAKAISLLRSDNGWDEGMKLLCRLAGLPDPLADIANAPTTPVDKLPSADREFSVRRRHAVGRAQLRELALTGKINRK